MASHSMSSPLTIGQAAAQSGISVRMIRHYESLGLLPATVRSASGYRQYGPADLHTLGFIRRARELGFSSAEIRQLLTLWQQRSQDHTQVRAIAQQHLDDLTRRIQGLQAMQQTLRELVQHCQHGTQPECPILQDLAAPDAACPSCPQP